MLSWNPARNFLVSIAYYLNYAIFSRMTTKFYKLEQMFWILELSLDATLIKHESMCRFNTHSFGLRIYGYRCLCMFDSVCSLRLEKLFRTDLLFTLLGVHYRAGLWSGNYSRANIKRTHVGYVRRYTRYQKFV